VVKYLEKNKYLFWIGEEFRNIIKWKRKTKIYFSKEKRIFNFFNCPESKKLITNLRSDCLKYDFIIERREPTRKNSKK
jgi:hypothetical protein